MSEGHAYKCDYCGHIEFFGNDMIPQDRRISPPGWFAVAYNTVTQWEMAHYCGHKCVIAGVKP